MMGRRGFTLIEMVVALSVTAVLTVLMLRMFIDSSTLWEKNEERLDAFREARAALQLMARELGNVNAIPDAPEPYPILALQHHPASEAENHANQEIYALTSIPNSGQSDLCAIGYFCAWDEKKKAFVLRRQFTESNATFANLRKTLGVNPPLNGGAAFGIVYDRATTENGDERVQDVATYVWDLQFVIPGADATQVAPAWPQGFFARQLPPWIEIRFKALSGPAARRLADQPITRETWFDKSSTAYQRLILPGEQQFVTRVKLSR